MNQVPAQNKASFFEIKFSGEVKDIMDLYRKLLSNKVAENLNLSDVSLNQKNGIPVLSIAGASVQSDEFYRDLQTIPQIEKFIHRAANASVRVDIVSLNQGEYGMQIYRFMYYHATDHITHSRACSVPTIIFAADKVTRVRHVIGQDFSAPKAVYQVPSSYCNKRLRALAEGKSESEIEKILDTEHFAYYMAGNERLTQFYKEAPEQEKDSRDYWYEKAEGFGLPSYVDNAVNELCDKKQKLENSPLYKDAIICTDKNTFLNVYTDLQWRLYGNEVVRQAKDGTVKLSYLKTERPVLKTDKTTKNPFVVGTMSEIVNSLQQETVNGVGIRKYALVDSHGISHELGWLPSKTKPREISTAETSEKENEEVNFS